MYQKWQLPFLNILFLTKSTIANYVRFRVLKRPQKMSSPGCQGHKDEGLATFKGTVLPSYGARIGRLTQVSLMSSCKHFR